MRVIKLNDEIIEEDKRNEFDSDYKDLYSSNVNYNLDNIKKRVGKKISTTNVKKKFSSNKEIFDMNMKKFKKELKTIKEGIYSNKEDKSKKKKNKKSKKTKDSSEQKNHKESTIVKANENNLHLQSISNAENSKGSKGNKKNKKKKKKEEFTKGGMVRFEDGFEEMTYFEDDCTLYTAEEIFNNFDLIITNGLNIKVELDKNITKNLIIFKIEINVEKTTVITSPIVNILLELSFQTSSPINFRQ